jgi:hypothetical protein
MVFKSFLGNRTQQKGWEKWLGKNFLLEEHKRGLSMRISAPGL